MKNRKLIVQIDIYGGRMRIGVIQASSQATKNKMLYKAVKKYAPKDSEVINFGCTLEEKENYSYDVGL